MCVSAIIASGLAAAGTIYEGNAKKQAQDAQALGDDIQAAQEIEASKQEAIRIRRAGEKTAGAARAALAASGISVDSGTAININEDITQGAELDAFNTILTGKRKADAFQRSASQARAVGQNAVSASILSAAASGAKSYAGWKGVRK